MSFNDLFEVDGVEVMTGPDGGRGGARRGAGTRSSAERQATAEALETMAVPSYDISRARKEAALADKEAALAQINMIEAKVKAGEYVSRVAVREATATAFSAIAQTLRSIPDLLERKLALPPTVAAAVGAQIDESLAALADELEAMPGCDDLFADY